MNVTDILVMPVASYFVNMYFLGCLRRSVRGHCVLPLCLLQGARYRDQAMAGRHAQAYSCGERHHSATPWKLAAGDGTITVGDFQ